jgi:hypothetical protein
MDFQKDIEENNLDITARSGVKLPAVPSNPPPAAQARLLGAPEIKTPPPAPQPSMPKP